MRYFSICSGIEAASVAWHPLGWQAVGFAENDKFASAVLAHHYPDVPNYGDITKFKDWPDAAFDVLVGGTPCQSFSVAGLRKGLADPRGNLTLTFLAIAGRYKPRYIVWENVPGILSDSTDALTSFLDGLEALGYIVDVDILDAQWFGLAQRRRRVFVCGQSVKDILQVRSISSALTILQCLAECLALTLTVLSGRSTTKSENSGFGALEPLPSLRRRMQLFELDSPAEAASILGKSLAAIQASSECERGGWDSGSGKNHTKICKANTKSPESTELRTGNIGESQNTELSWRSTSADALAVMNECITSTVQSETIGSKIFTCAQTLLHIAEHITLSTRSSPVFWSAASSSLIALEAFTDYARSTTSDLFGDLERVQAWRDFIEQAEGTCESLGDIAVANFEHLLLISESLCWDTAPRREAGQRAAPTIAARTRGGGGLGADFDCDGGLVASTGELSHCLNAGGMGRIDYETETLVAHSLRADSFDASEDGTGRETPLVPVSGFNNTGQGWWNDADVAAGLRDMSADTAPTLRAMGHDGSHANAGGQVAIAFDCKAGANTGFAIGDTPGALRATTAQVERPHDTANIRAASGGSSRSYVAGNWAVRRLTPLECERLQGFPDDYLSQVTWRGKSPPPDGPMYKALGNSMAVNCMRWLGTRIQMVEDEMSPAIVRNCGARGLQGELLLSGERPLDSISTG